MSGHQGSAIAKLKIAVCQVGILMMVQGAILEFMRLKFLSVEPSEGPVSIMDITITNCSNGTRAYFTPPYGGQNASPQGRRGLGMRAKFAATVVAFILALCAAPCFALNADELALVIPAAERGSAASQVLLAVAYLHGDGGLVKTPAKAAYWFEQAAIRGNVYAQGRLADLYEQGLGVPANPKLAFGWRLKAANRGDVQAQVKVGKMYQEGLGIAKDIDQALYWFRRAATEGNAEAQFLLGRLYHDGAGVKVDRAASRSWLEQSAQNGYEGAVLFLNLIESIGYHIDEDWHSRIPELKQLAADGDLEAQYQLAQRYERGIGGCKKDTATALGWYRRAASGGHLMAMQTLAHIYAEGIDGVQRDPDAAAKWEERAKAAAH